MVLAFRVGLARWPVGRNLGANLAPGFVGFALLLAPLWFFAFGAGEQLRDAIRSRWLRICLPAMLGVPYVVFALPAGNFHWPMAAAMLALPVALAAFLEFSRLPAKLAWQDGVVLAAIATIHLLRLLEGAWPYPGLAALPKLFLADLILYLYLVVRRLEGVGYSFQPARDAFLIGLREWAYFLPFGLGLGLALNFIHFHAELPPWTRAAAAVPVTFLLVAVPEEIFFRGILQNLLETRLGRRAALLVAALLFGLGHFHRGVSFNWRYVLLAAVAGIFYGRAWRARRQVLASSITHTAVDVVWSLWLR